MRELHFVEVDPLSGRIILATSDDLERFDLAIDQPLREATRPVTNGAIHVGTTAPRPSTEVAITPRDIQMRVRAGESAEALADEHGASLDWVMRFALPVLAERTRIADEARRAKARRSTTEGQTVVFGDAVDARFTAHGIDPTAVRWDAHRREDAQWIISAHWVGGQSERVAEWTFQLAGRTVAAIDDTAADLLSDRPIRPLVTTPDEAPTGLSLAPPFEPGPAMADAHTGPLPRPEELFDQSQFIDPNEPPLPLHLPDQPRGARVPRYTNLGIAGRGGETDDEKAARATIPSWDDILLGVRRKHD